MNNFNITDNTAKLRLVNYLNKANGNNTTLYSFFYKSVFLDLLELSLYHPTKGGYTDWAFVAGLVSSGKVLLDASKLLLYKNTNWFGDKEHIENQDKKLYENAGLNQKAHSFGKLFRAIDSFIYVLRTSSPIRREEAIEAAVFIYEVNLLGLSNEIKMNGNNFSEYEKKLIAKIDNANHIQEKLELSLNIVEYLDSNLSAKYKEFYKKAIGFEWGIIK